MPPCPTSVREGRWQYRNTCETRITKGRLGWAMEKVTNIVTIIPAISWRRIISERKNAITPPPNRAPRRKFGSGLRSGGAKLKKAGRTQASHERSAGKPERRYPPPIADRGGTPLTGGANRWLHAHC